jgi:hypothetical protein
VLLRDGYACVHAEAERFIASFLFSNHEPAASGSGFFSLAENCAAAIDGSKLEEKRV